MQTPVAARLLKLAATVLLFFVPSESVRQTVDGSISATVDASNNLAFKHFAARGSDFSDFLKQVEENHNLQLVDDMSDAAVALWPAEWEEKLRAKKQVGQGAFGKVFVAQLQCSTDSVAVKELQLTKQNAQELRDEVKLLKRFSGPDFVKMFDHSENSKQLLIMMEAATGGDLGKVVSAPQVGVGVRMQLFVEALRGVAAMNDAGFVHRDLKPANILVSAKCEKGPCHAKVADLGLSCSTGGEIVKCAGIGGTPLYMAPETYAYQAKKVSFPVAVQPKNDVFSLGLILYELLYRDLPSQIAQSKTMQELARNIMNFQIEKDARYKKMDSELQKIFHGMLEKDVATRWTSSKALPLVTDWATSQGAQIERPQEASLPPCWSRKEVPEGPKIPEVPDNNGDDADGQLVILSLASPMTNIEVNVLAKVWDKQGNIKIPDNMEKYAPKNLKNGDRIVSIMDKPFEQITESVWDLMREGAFGARGAPLVVKLLRKQ